MISFIAQHEHVGSPSLQLQVSNCPPGVFWSVSQYGRRQWRAPESVLDMNKRCKRKREKQPAWKRKSNFSVEFIHPTIWTGSEPIVIIFIHAVCNSISGCMLSQDSEDASYVALVTSPTVFLPIFLFHLKKKHIHVCSVSLSMRHTGLLQIRLIIHIEGFYHHAFCIFFFYTALDSFVLCN